MAEARSLVVPSRLTVEVEPSAAHPVVAGAVLSIRCFARERNDYRLGPLFADASGVVSASDAQIGLLAEAQLETDLMGLKPITSAFPLVELRLLRRADIERAVEGRRIWGLVGDESTLYGSAESLIQRYEQSPSLGLSENPFPPRVRDEWLDASPKRYRLPML